MIEDPNNFGILCSDEEKQTRQSLCNTCSNNRITESGNICDGCACPIEYIIMYKFKNCPLNKWEVL
jgi:hypothetical protein